MHKPSPANTFAITRAIVVLPVLGAAEHQMQSLAFEVKPAASELLLVSNIRFQAADLGLDFLHANLRHQLRVRFLEQNILVFDPFGPPDLVDVGLGVNIPVGATLVDELGRGLTQSNFRVCQRRNKFRVRS